MILEGALLDQVLAQYMWGKTDDTGWQIFKSMKWVINTLNLKVNYGK